MDDLNRRFNQTNNAMIGFYMKCDPTYINNTTHVTKTFTGASLLMAANNDPGSFNVHIIGSFASPGTAGFSIPFLNASMVPSGSYTDGRANGDLAHEIGHLLGLSHTHQYSTWDWKCLTECVSRTRTWPTFNLCPTRLISNRVCEATGDGLRDTQADDNLIHNSNCDYNVSFGNDPWGDSYDNPPAGLQDRPDVHNIMSYNSATDCVDHFSRLQIGAMLWNLYHKNGANFDGWSNPACTFDNYEPDNGSIVARPIVVNEIQERNFHQQWNKSFPNGYFTQCDVDWVRFIPSCSQTFDIQTSAMTGRIDANTRLAIFDNSLNQLAQNDDISTSNHYSKISLSLTASQTYFIRVENGSTNVTGYYNLNVAAAFAINGDDYVCSASNDYTISNLPSGATVTWSITPAYATVNTPNAAQTTLTRIADGLATLTATITNACSPAPINVTKQIVVGKPTVTGGYTVDGTYYPIKIYSGSSYDYNEICKGHTANTTLTVNNANNVSWTRTYASPTNTIWWQQGNNIEVYFWALNQKSRFQLQATNACGSFYQTYAFRSKACSGGCLQYQITPNPVGANNIIIVVPNIPPPCDDPPIPYVTGKNMPSLHSKLTITEVRLYDNLGVLKKVKKAKNVKQLSMQIGNLNPGIYYMEVTNGTYTEMQKVIVQ